MSFRRFWVSATLCAMLSTTLSFPAVAANWIYVYNDADENQYYYDSTSIRHSGNFVTVWQKTMFAKIQPDGEKRRMTQVRYDCAAETLTVLSAASYNTKKELIGSATFNRSQQKEDPIIPDTIGQASIDVVCLFNG